MPIKPAPSPTAPSADVSPLLAGLNAGNLVLGGKNNRLINSRRCSSIGSNDLVLGRSYNHHVVGSEKVNKTPTIALVNYDPTNFRGMWVETSEYQYGHTVLHNDGYYYVYNNQVNNSLEWGITIPPDGNYSSGGILIWIRASINTSVSGDMYEFDGFSSNEETFMQNIGAYYFSNIPQSHPIAFINKGKPVRYGGEFWAGRQTIEGSEYDFFYGSVVLDIMGDFGVMSYCSLSGYMGGYQNLIFDISSPSPNRGALSVNLNYSNYTENALTVEDRTTLRKMCDYFQNVIIADMGLWGSAFYKEGEYLEGTFNYQLDVVNFSSENNSASGGTLAFAGPRNVSRERPSIARSDYDFFVTPVGGRMAVDPLDLDYLREETEYPDKNKLYWTMLHEVGHAFGIGTLWNTRAWSGSVGNNFIRLTEENGAQYIGKNAVREYNRLVGGNFDSLPVQTLYVSEDPDPNNNDPNKKIIKTFTSPTLTQYNSGVEWGTTVNGEYVIVFNDPWTPSHLSKVEFVPIPQNIVDELQSGIYGQTFDYTLFLTWRGHWAELSADSVTDGRQYRLYTNPDGTTIEQPYITEEIMTPYFDGYAPWTRMSTAFLHDLGYIVDYSQDNPIFDTSNEYSIIESKNLYKETTELISNPYFATNLNGWSLNGDVGLVEDGLCVIKNQGSISQNINLFTNVTYYLSIKMRGLINVLISNIQITSQYVDSGNPVPEQWDASKVYQYGEVVYYTDASSFSGIYQRKSADPGSSGFSPDRYLPSGLPEEYIYWDIIELNINILEESILYKKFGHELAPESSFEIPIVSKAPSLKLYITHESGVSCSVIQVSLNRQLPKSNQQVFIEDNHSMNVFGKLICAGDIFTSHISDKRLKNNINPIKGCLDKVLGMNAVQFDWNKKQETYTGKDIGLIAQQVERVCPEVVETRKDGFKAIKYEKITPLLIGSIKESQEKLNKIKQKLNNES
jgi:hypothetical protein